MPSKPVFHPQWHPLRHALALMTLLWCAVGARADEADRPTFLLSGFGTLGLAHSTQDRADFTSSPLTKPSGVGYSHSWSGDVDSRLGLQLMATLNPQASAVLQVISQQRYDGSYRPEVEWANIKYAFTPDFSVRVGRIAMPTYLVSDYRHVGYSTPWVRPPLEFYGQVPITKNDGLDASYRLQLGEATSTVQFSFGSSELKSPTGAAPVLIENSRGIFNKTELGAASFNLAYQVADLSFGGAKPLFDGLRQFGPSGVALADRYDAHGRPVTLLSFGASYDPGNWLLMGEWSSVKSDSFIGEHRTWYATGAYRMGAFTPYLTYSRSTQLGNRSDPGLDLASLPGFLVPSAAALNAGLNALLAPTSSQTVSVGSRWDFRNNLTLKLQFDHTRLDENSTGLLINTQPDFQRGSSFNVFSVAIDFVF